MLPSVVLSQPGSHGPSRPPRTSPAPSSAIVEKYDIERRESDVSAGIKFGYSANQIGFGWTNGAYLDLLAGLETAERRPAAAP